jgi:hypothetical protein
LTPQEPIPAAVVVEEVVELEDVVGVVVVELVGVVVTVVVEVGTVYVVVEHCCVLVPEMIGESAEPSTLTVCAGRVAVAHTLTVPVVSPAAYARTAPRRSAPIRIAVAVIRFFLIDPPGVDASRRGCYPPPPLYFNVDTSTHTP